MESRLLLAGVTPPNIQFDPNWLADIMVSDEDNPGRGTPLSGVGLGANPDPGAPATGSSWDAVNFDTNGTYNGFYYIPPDPNAAAGPGDVVNVVNSTIQWYSKSGTLENAVRLGRNSSGSITGSFFESLSPFHGTYDPKVLYDQYNGRFVLVALDQTDTGNGDASNTSRILIAVSDDSNPAGTWYYQSINAVVNISGTDYWCDYPGLAIGSNAIYITGNLFGFNTGSFGGSRLWIVSKSGLYSGGSASVGIYDPSTASGLPSEAFTLQPTSMFGTAPAGTGTFLVSSGWTSGSTDYISVIRVGSSISSPTFSNTLVNLGNISTTFTPAEAPQLGSAQTIDSGDGRIYNAVWRNNNLYFANVVSPQNGVDAHTCTAHWYRVQADASSISLADQGNVSGEDIAAGTRTFYPSVMVDSAGDMAIGFSASGPNIYPGAYYTGRLSTDPAGTLQSSGTLQAGVDFYYRTFGGTRNRWGDYSGLALDPTDSSTFWVYNEYARPRGVSSGGDGRWGTRYGTFSLISATPGTPVLAAASDTGSSSTDGITSRNNSSPSSALTFTVPGTISGALVQLLSDGSVIGSATATGSSTLIVTNGAAALLDGVRSITARQAESGKSVSNTSSALSLTIDTVGPSISANRDGLVYAGSHGGWNNTNVIASYIASDGGSGLVDPSNGTYTFTSEGAGQSHSFAVFDVAGNSASASVTNVNIDKTVPSISAGRGTLANGAGWNKTDVQISYSATDSGSGLVDPASGAYTFTSEGAGQSHSFTVFDLAGNSASASVTNVNIDKTAPTTSTSLSGTAGSGGWFTSSVTVTLNESDALSGIAQTQYSLDAGNTWQSYVSPFAVSAQGSTTVQFYSTDVAGNMQTIQTQSFKIDSLAPTVTAVYVRGSAWAAGYLSFLAADLPGSSATYGYAIPVGSGAAQLQTLPWRNINQISIAFSEDVSITQAQFAIVGSVGSYSVSGFSYSSIDHVATWSLSAAIGPDRLYVAVPGSGSSPVRDAAGNILDGEWTNPSSFGDAGPTSSFPSGNGTAGGDFAFRLDVLPGDSTGGSLGKVNVADIAQTKTRNNQPVTVSTYRSDFDGNNLVNVADIAYVKTKSNVYSLPIDPPTPPDFNSLLI